MLVAGAYASLVALSRCPVTAILSAFLNCIAPKSPEQSTSANHKWRSAGLFHDYLGMLCPSGSHCRCLSGIASVCKWLKLIGFASSEQISGLYNLVSHLTGYMQVHCLLAPIRPSSAVLRLVRPVPSIGREIFGL
jgi:hypothetical protein